MKQPDCMRAEKFSQQEKMKRAVKMASERADKPSNKKRQ